MVKRAYSHSESLIISVSRCVENKITVDWSA